MGRKAHNQKEYPLFNEMVQEGATLTEMSGAFGFTRQTASKRILNRKLSEAWKKGKASRAAKEKEDTDLKMQMYSHLVRTMYENIQERIEGEPFASRKALEYMQTHQIHRDGEVGWDSLLKLFEKYERSANNCRKLSLGALSRHCGIIPATVSRVLKASKLKTLSHSYKKTRTKVDEEKERTIMRCKGTAMPYSDLARFMGAETPSLRRRLGKRDRVKFPYGEGSFYCAFEVYEAQNLGFKLEEISDLLDVSQDMARFSLSNQPEITGVIKKDLKKVYGSKVPERYGFMFGGENG